ncbi:MAG: dihydrodipicolinate synthase family protein, partial [Pseudomonadota bacterium]|nr:dihydrodipicolinate synthase family protein [Pseudomonadota bacterium]
EEGFVQLSGEDATIGAFLGQGGDGCISVTSNVAPKLCSEMHEAWQARDLDGFAERRDRLAPLHDALFCETSPAPVKYAAHLLGKSDPKCRLPIAPLSEQGQETIRKAIVKVGLIN